MKKNRLVLLTLMITALFVFPVFAEGEEENLEDMPTTVDETANESEPEPNMPEIKKESTYFGVVDIWGGYTTLAMGKVNDMLGENTLYPNGTTTKITGGYVLGVDLGFMLIKDLPLALGLRVELIGSTQGKFTGDLGITSTSLTLDSSLIPIMAGASYTFEIPETQISVSADLYAGYSIAKATYVNDSKLFGVGDKITSVYNGSAFTLDIGATVNYQINEPTSAGITLGYRTANVASMTADKDVVVNSVTVINKGDKFEDSGNNTVPFDFSGFNIGVNVDMKY